MSGFSSQWLASREPIDRAARNPEILGEVADHFRKEPSTVIADIGSGTGSTVRSMDHALTGKIQWHLFDNDPVLIASTGELENRSDVSLHEVDLSVSLDRIFEAGPGLVTTSAFLDLVSRHWIHRLVEDLKTHKMPLYASLSYDGRASCEPVHEADRDIYRAFNLHQQTDKGFGPALGPEAVSVTIRELKAAGFQVITGKSDWVADGAHRQFQEFLLAGWHEAACEIEPENRSRFDDWLEKRLEQIRRGQLTVRVGHQDIFAIPGF